MTDRTRLARTLRLTSSLALLASILVAPARPSRFAVDPPRLQALLIPSGQTPLLDAPPPPEDMGLSLDLGTEGEKRDDEQEFHGVLIDTQLPPLPPRPLPWVVRHGLASSRPSRAYFPLRC